MTDIDVAALRATSEDQAAECAKQSTTDVNVTGVRLGSRYHPVTNPAVVLALLDALEDEQWLRRSLEAQVADGDNRQTMRFGALRALLRTTRPMGLAETEEQP